MNQRGSSSGREELVVPTFEEAAAPSDHSGSRSMDALFLCSGPKVSIINTSRILSHLQKASESAESDDIAMMQYLWGRVHVPVDVYWSCGQPQAAAGEQREGPRPSAGGLTSSSIPVRVADPLHLHSSFYTTRLGAMTGGGYTGPQRGSTVVALDRPLPLGVKRRRGAGEKVFSVFQRYASGGPDGGLSPLPFFIQSIPHPSQRNLYALVDGTAPLDPFIDFDCALPLPSEQHPVNHYVRGGVSLAVAVEYMLGDVIQYFQGKWAELLKVGVEAECALFTSSFAIAELHHRFNAPHEGTDEGDGGEGSSSASTAANRMSGKISYHIHFRLADGAAVKSMEDLSRMMRWIHQELLEETSREASATAGEASESEESSQPNHGPSEGNQAQAASSFTRRLPVIRRMILACVDFSVYTRWRALRLPYCVKAPHIVASPASSVASTSSSNGETAAPSVLAHTYSPSEEEVLLEQLALFYPEVRIPPCHVGAAAPHILWEWSCENQQLHTSSNMTPSPSSPLHLLQAAGARTPTLAHLLEALEFRLRFLLPVVPGHTVLRTSVLLPHLCKPSNQEQQPSQTSSTLPVAYVNQLMDRSLVQRDREPQLLLVSPTIPQPDASAAPSTSGAAPLQHPFSIPRRPLISGATAHVKVTDFAVKALLAEVFRCLHPAFTGCCVRPPPGSSNPFSAWAPSGSSSSSSPLMFQRITPERIQAQFDPGPVRGYYVYQKQSTYCVRQGRCHKATYSQLYMTYGSIKVRCYSNDCYQSCEVVQWKAPPTSSSSAAAAGPQQQQLDVGGVGPSAPQDWKRCCQYERLSEIHDILFPELPREVLLDRYGAEVGT